MIPCPQPAMHHFDGWHQAMDSFEQPEPETPLPTQLFGSLIALQQCHPPLLWPAMTSARPGPARGTIIDPIINTVSEMQYMRKGIFHLVTGTALALALAVVVGLRAEKIRYRRERYRDQDRPDQPIQRTGLRLCHRSARPRPPI